MWNQGDSRRTDTPTQSDLRPHQRHSTGPVVAEVLFGLFGIYGVGWLMGGQRRLGTILLVLSAIWVLIEIVAVHTIILICGIVPANILFMALSGIALRRTLDRQG